MKMGSASTALIVAVAMVVMSGSLLKVAEAQSCLTVAGGAAPFADAANVVAQLRTSGQECCQTSSGYCTVQVESGNAAATVCGATGICPKCADVGNDLNIVLADCNNNNYVEGVYSPDGGQTLYYLTSASNHP
ncbi:unnamed protein product [Calypogeia fissa]